MQNFELIQERQIPELNSRARLFRHTPTGAQLLSLENNDENKVFGIAFRTPPPDSTGLPHIMEHSVLCGSQKYPVKEPFVELMKGSQATFLNAFTYPDKTCYPVASQNLQDFYNLIDVYVDAVFHPLIPPHILQQEGWHYELDDPEGELSYKGVVFNEMKGAYSSPDSVLMREIQHSLFPDTAYGVDSGGDPRVIPNLTYEQFKRFHETYYHPSNALIYFYGDDDPDRRLELMEGYLKEYSPIQVDSTIQLQKPFKEPRRLRYPYAVGEGEEGKAYLTLNWVLTDNQDPEEALALTILGHILIGTPASPLRKALIDSGLGEDLTGMGMESELRQFIFSTGLKGIAQDDAGKVEALIDETLRKLATEGIDPNMVQAAINTIEFRLREQNTGAFPRGLALMLAALTTWLHDRDPLAPLAFEAPLGSIKQQVESGERLFEDLIRKYLLENSHKTVVLLEPDPEMAAKLEADERRKLDEARSQMSPEQLETLVEDTRRLKKLQETPDSPEALASIPSLKLEDLDRKIRTIPLEELEIGATRVLYHDLFTNGIVYLDLGFDLHSLPGDLLPYVPLFSRALTEMGTETQDFVELSMRIGKHTGGIRSANLTTLHRTTGQDIGWMFLRGKSTVAKAGELLAVLRDILLTVRLDNPERFRQMVLEEKANLEASLPQAGHRFVNARLRGRFDPAGWAAEQLGGVDYLFFIRKLAGEVNTNWSGVLEKLEQLRRALINRNTAIANLTLDRESWNSIRGSLEEFLTSLPEAAPSQSRWTPGEYPPDEGLTIPAQINFVGKAARLFDLGYSLDGSISVILNYLRSTYIWERVRVQGGAYGGFVTFDTRSGVLAYLSYRDPNLADTLQVYDGTPEFLKSVDVSREELSKTIVGTIGEMDDYQLPDAKGYTSLVRYLAGETDELRQQYRDQVFETTVEDFRRLAEPLDRLRQVGEVVVIGAAEKIAEAGNFEVKKVL